MELLVTGAGGLTGHLFLEHLAKVDRKFELTLLIRRDLNFDLTPTKNLKLICTQGDSSVLETWKKILLVKNLQAIIHIASIHHTPVLLRSLVESSHKPRLVVIGTTGVYSQYNQYSATYKSIEQQLQAYTGSYCLLRPTMIYGSHRDKNLHKLIRFGDRHQFFPVFGSGQSLLQPVHADDLAQALLAVLLNPQIEGAYDLSGGTVVTFLELLALVEKLLGKPVRPLRIPYNLGLWSATLAETFLGKRSPIRREQILRLQEDKAYSYEAAQRDFGYNPRSLEVGLTQEIEILRAEGII